MAISIHSVILAVKLAVKKANAYTDQKTSGLAGGIKYKGAVSYYSDLANLTNVEEGDGYTVKYSGTSGTTPDGTEYVWGYDSELQAMAWIDWSKDSYTKSEVDALLAPIETNISLLQEHFVFSANSKTYYLQPEQPSNPQDGDVWIG